MHNTSLELCPLNICTFGLPENRGIQIVTMAHLNGCSFLRGEDYRKIISLLQGVWKKLMILTCSHLPRTNDWPNLTMP